ncbi:MAG: carboxynorspermidine decarboxylase [Oscillospiraceae bacterium]|jgi:carboxynorspermidine decarboxylase|nr:carboxynorspermidine decarboxylase [Oscillospiraceae bacterium]
MNLGSVLKNVKTPCYVIDEARLVRNLEILRRLEERTGCRVLLAQKAFSMYSLYPLIRKYVSGTAASGLYEARLGREEMGGEVHVFSPAYSESDFAELAGICGHIVFNSFGQWEKFKGSVPAGVSAGLRVNPEYSTQDKAIYDPCAPFSRLGATAESVRGKDLSGIEGLHFHALCEQNADALEATFSAVTEKFGYLFPYLKWINFGGGHHITKEGYDLPLLEKCVKKARGYGLAVYLEPGEAFALDAGYLAAEVLDVVHNGMDIAILDASAACHMPDVIEAPYRPEIAGAGKAGEKAYTCRLGGNTCLAGDIIGDYSFDEAPKPGDRVIFLDMAIYTMVKNNTFNGTPLPDIAVLRENGVVETVKRFGYGDFKNRL